MTKISRTLVATALACAFSTPGFAMTHVEEKAAKDRIAADYTADKATCGASSANARDICEAEAKGKRDVAKAQLHADMKPGRQGRYDLGVAKADAEHAVAREKCDDLAGNPKDVCLKEAKSAQVAARADAKSRMVAANANSAARSEVNESRARAAGKSVEAKKDAASDKNDADYAVAKARCDASEGAAKDSCMAAAKAQHGK